MTLAAVTPAARNRPRTAAPRATKATAHPRPVRARVAPANPRRVSGPKRPIRAQPTRASGAPLPSRAADFIRGLPDHSLLDRLVRGRAWIPVLGVMLAGIVAMQVEVLKLNASMGRSIALASSLQTRNELLRTSVSSLSNSHRIERLAARMGMAMPGPTSVDFLDGHASAARATAGIHVPDASAFDSALQASELQAAAATTSGASASTAASTTATTPTLSTTGVAGTGTASTATSAGGTGTTATTPSTTSATASSGGAAPAG